METNMTKLTQAQILNIVKNKQISKCSADHKAQVMAFMFGEEYIASDDKGAKRKYRVTHEAK
jgi:hypothetical protein